MRAGSPSTSCQTASSPAQTATPPRTASRSRPAQEDVAPRSFSRRQRSDSGTNSRTKKVSSAGTAPQTISSRHSTQLGGNPQADSVTRNDPRPRLSSATSM